MEDGRVTDRLSIRRFQQNDIDNLYKLLSDEEVMRYIEPPYSMEQTVSFLSQVGLCDSPMIFAVDNQSGRFIGYVIYHPYEEDSFEIGWILLKEYWHKGYAQKLTEALIEKAKGTTKYLVMECDPRQEATIQIALRNHFVYVGFENGCNVYRLKIDD